MAKIVDLNKSNFIPKPKFLGMYLTPMQLLNVTQQDLIELLFHQFQYITSPNELNKLSCLSNWVKYNNISDQELYTELKNKIPQYKEDIEIWYSARKLG